MGGSVVWSGWVDFVLIVSLQCVQMSPSGTIVMTSVIYRHGDRSPVASYPKGLGEKPWESIGGFGQLSHRGATQEYNLGKFLRQRYADLLGTEFNKNETYVRSTDYERTLMSAQSVLAGLYEPKRNSSDDKHWTLWDFWHPIPVHTVPQVDDILLLGNHYENCPKVNKLVAESDKFWEDYAKANKSLRNMMETVQNNTGATVSTVKDLIHIHDTLYCEYMHNIPTPSWVPAYFFHFMENIIGPQSYYHNYHGPERSRMTIGYFLHKVITDMQTRNAIGNDGSCCKMFMYSAHDSTMAAVLNGLQVYRNFSIPYATTLMIELIKRPITNHPYVRLVLRRYANFNATRTGEDPQLFNLTLPGCSPECPLERFIELTRDYVTDDPFQECNGYSEGTAIKQLSKVIIISAVTGTAILIVVMTLQIFCHRKYCRRKPRRHMPFRKIRADLPEEMPMMTSELGSDLED